MTRRIIDFLPAAVVLALMGLAAFATTSYAATAVAGSDPSGWDAVRAIYQAFANHQYAYAGALGLIAACMLIKKWLGDKWAFLHTDAGGSLLVLVAGTATATLPTLVLPEAHLTLALLKTALSAGVLAAGGYAMIKNLLINPVLKPLAAKAPAWMQPIFTGIFWFFDHENAGAAAIAKAEVAGTAAVTAAPATGVGGVIGHPGELP